MKFSKVLQKNLFKISIFIACFFGIISLYIYFKLGLQLAYNDSESHLNIARRIVDSLTPGLVQIGSTWLPLLHILEVPLIWNNFFWHSGLAGSIVSFISFVLSAIFIFKSIEVITRDRVSAFLGVMVLVSNANMLYLQSTAMFEPLLIMTFLGGFYFLLLWIRNGNILSLIFSAFFAMLSTLSRYDGWATLIGFSVYIFLYGLIYTNFKKAKGFLLLFLTLGAFGIFLWLIYNLVIFGNPFYFAFNEFSAFSQQALLASKGNLPTKANIFLSLAVYLSSVILNQGVIFTTLLFLGLLLYSVKNKFSFKGSVLYLLFIPFAFNLYALYKGHSVIWLPNLPPYFDTFFNVRYGLLLIPATTIFIGFLSSKSALLKVIVTIAIVMQIVFFYSLFPTSTNHLSFVLLKDTVASINKPTEDAAMWLKKNYKGGLILISSASSESFIFHTQLNLVNFITEGTGHYWFESLKDPSSHAEWVVFFPSFTDRVGKALKNNSKLLSNYNLVYSSDTYFIFQKKKQAQKKVNLKNWNVQSANPVDLSRNQSRYFFIDKTYKNKVLKELKEIKSSGANFVTISTPYNDEFVPVLKYWTTQAHKLKLKVWFNGGFAEWEGWFSYKKNKSISDILSEGKKFINNNSNLFEDGDAFTLMPQAEDGGPWNPVKQQEFINFKNFIVSEYELCANEFSRLGIEIKCNWIPINSDLAPNIIDDKTLNELDNLIVINRRSKTSTDLSKNLETIYSKFGANIMLSNFIGDDSQLKTLFDNEYIEGVDYNFSYSDLEKVHNTNNYFSPVIINGNVISKENTPMKVTYGRFHTFIDGKKNFSIKIPAGYRELIFETNNYTQVIPVITKEGSTIYVHNYIFNRKNQTENSEYPIEYNILNNLISTINKLKNHFYYLQKNI